jgi:hypothetical protein
MTRRRAAELLFVLTGPALYRYFVLEAGWAPRDWTRWVASILIRDLLPDQCSTAGRETRPAVGTIA